MPSPPLFLVSLLVLAHALLLACAATTPHAWPEPEAALAVGLALGQLYLAALWAVCSPGNIAWRCAGALALAAGVAYVIGLRVNSEFFGAWQMVLEFLAVDVGLLTVARVFHQASRNVNAARATFPGKWQFSIWDVLCLTTAAGLLLGAGCSIAWQPSARLATAALLVITGVSVAAHAVGACTPPRAWALFLAACLAAGGWYALSRLVLPHEVLLSQTAFATILLSLVALRTVRGEAPSFSVSLPGVCVPGREA